MFVAGIVTAHDIAQPLRQSSMKSLVPSCNRGSLASDSIGTSVVDSIHAQQKPSHLPEAFRSSVSSLWQMDVCCMAHERCRKAAA